MLKENLNKYINWKAILIMIIAFIPFLILLINYRAGYQEISLRGNEITCTSNPCPCDIHSELVGRGNSVDIGYTCPINTYGIGLYTCLVLFTFLATFLYQLSKANLDKAMLAYIISAVLFWILAWIAITAIFHIPVVYDEPRRGNYIILNSAFKFFFQTYKNFIAQLFVLGFFAFVASIAGIIGAFVALTFKEIFAFFVKIKNRHSDV